MKKTAIISALLLGFSVAGMSQSMTSTSEQLTVIAMDTLSPNRGVYHLMGVQSGRIFKSLPIAAQLNIGEVIIGRYRTNVIKGNEKIENGDWKSQMTDNNSGGANGQEKTIVENERTGLLFLKGK